MGTFAVGDVVLLPFPYADLKRFKKRPALVVGEAEFDNLILCQITSKGDTSIRAISLHNADFSKGTLRIDSYIRFDKLFTVEPSIILGRVGALKTTKSNLVRSRVRELFSS
jgi:mRNA interferase MazF